MDQDVKIWKIRTVKDYADAHNHILVGRILDLTESYVRLHCKSYHFDKTVNSVEDIREGCLMVRIVPWHRIEIINELAPTFAYPKAKLNRDDEQAVVLHDGALTCSLVSQYDKRY